MKTSKLSASCVSRARGSSEKADTREERTKNRGHCARRVCLPEEILSNRASESNDTRLRGRCAFGSILMARHRHSS